MRRVLSTLFLLFIAFWAAAQEEPKHWSEMMMDPSVNFYDVQEAFEQDWQGREVEKGKGFKQFKRWEWFMEQRVYPSGDRFDAMASWKAIQDEMRNMPQGERMSGVWSYFGNTSVPGSGGGAGRINMVRTDPNNPNVYFACAPGGGLWRSDNAGGSWTLLNTDLLASIGVTDVAIDHTNSDVLYIATGDGDAGDTYSLGVLKSTDGGNTWSSTGLNWDVTQTRRINRMIMHPTDNNILIAATSNGMYKTSDGGASWSQTQGGNFKDVEWKPGTPATVYAVGNSDEFYRSTNTGDSFSNIVGGLPTSGVTRFALGVSADSPNTVYILAGASNNGFQGFYRSLDSGANWTQMANSPNLMGWSETGSDSGGQAWYDLAIAVDPNDANTVFVGGVNIWKTTDGGSNWSCSGHWYGAAGLPYVHADHHGFNFIPGTSTLLVGCDGGVFSTSNGGNSYTDLSANLEIAQIYRLGIAQTDQNLVISGWQDNGTNLKDGANWTRVIGGDGFESAIDPTNDNIMFGALYYGQIFKSTNGGGSFSTIVNSGGTGVDENGAWLTPYILDPSDPNTMYIGKSTVYRSTDGGGSFTALGAIAGGNINGLAVAKSDNNYIYCSKGSTLYRSTDGTNFASISGGLPNLTITYIAIDPADENRVWVTLSGYSNGNKVYYSADGGANWTNFSTGLPNIPANCITYYEGSNDALYVGTDAGTYYRDGDFSSWQPYKDGLPNVVVTELEIHEATNTIVASTYGRGIWHAPLFSLPANDAGIVAIDSPEGTQCLETVSPSITIGCFGENSLTAVTIEYGIQGGTVTSYNWTGNLATGETATIVLPDYNEGTGAFVFEANITAVNGNASDDSAINNSSSQSYFVSGGINDVTLALTTDCWGNETTWAVTDGDGNEIFNGSGYGNQQTYNETLCLPDGCFTLTIYDSYGDGLAGTAFGCGTDGNYVLTDDQGNVLVSMPVANFGSQADHPFCLGGVTPGCTDNAACNYNPAATANDGSCTYPGCTNPTACNYDDTAGCDDGNCLLPDGCTDSSACNYDPAATCDDGSCLLPDGCTDNTACNYDANASCDDGSCSFPPVGFDCDCENSASMNFPNIAGNASESITFDGSGEASQITLDLNYTNITGDGSWAGDVAMELISPNGTCLEWGGYNSNIGCANLIGNYTVFPGTWQSSASGFYTTTIDLTSVVLDGAGTWTFTVHNGYGASGGGGYDLTITVDGICIGDPAVQGCMDPGACNYDPAATADDGTCEYNSCLGCTDATACNYDPTAIIDDGSCAQFDECGNCGGTSTAGCTDPTACNYDASASCDDGSCQQFDECGNCGGTDTAGCTDPTACNYDANASCDDGSCQQFDECGNCGGTSTAGCTDPTACNYDASASCDDGTCILPDGCTDDTACNYDPAATCDNGTCEYDSCAPCIGDLTGDGNRDVSDLLMLLQDYGCQQDCMADMTGDDAVDTADMLMFLGFFGTPCD